MGGGKEGRGKRMRWGEGGGESEEKWQVGV